jgi:hypothetical protein
MLPYRRRQRPFFFIAITHALFLWFFCTLKDKETFTSAVTASTVSAIPVWKSSKKTMDGVVEGQHWQCKEEEEQEEQERGVPRPWNHRFPRRNIFQHHHQQRHNNTDHLERFVHDMSRRGQLALTRSIPALSVYSRRCQNHGDDDDKSKNNKKRRGRIRNCEERELIEVAVKKQKQQQQQQLDKDDQRHSSTAISIISSRLPSPSGMLDHAGFYYGIDAQSLSKEYDATTRKKRSRTPRLKDSMNEALEELKILRQEMERMREEMHVLKLKMVGEDDDESGQKDREDNSEEAKARRLMIRRKRQKEAEKLAAEIEVWAQQMLQEGEAEGWKPVECNKMVRGTVNQNERTTAYIKWMKDSRADKADKDDPNDYPCIKCYSTIDAPLEDVCTYLSEEAASVDYNDVVEKHKDVEEISPSAKICWSASPQILFIKPRDFVTFCHHKWKNDGTEVIVNQACDHPDYPLEEMEKEGKSCRGYALRGANCKFSFLSIQTLPPNFPFSPIHHCSLRLYSPFSLSRRSV